MSVSGDTTEKTTSKANINPVDIYNLVKGLFACKYLGIPKNIIITIGGYKVLIASFHYNESIKSQRHFSFEKQKKLRESSFYSGIFWSPVVASVLAAWPPPEHQNLVLHNILFVSGTSFKIGSKNSSQCPHEWSQRLENFYK